MKLVFRTLLLALILSPVDAVLAETQRFSKWTFASQTDEFTDKVSVSIYSELKRGFHLTLACADNKPFLMVGSLFEETVLFSKVVYADFRVDSKRAISFQGTDVDSIIAFSSNDESSMLVEYFRNGRKLLFRADDFRGRRFTDTISLDGFDMALDHFANYCPK